MKVEERNSNMKQLAISSKLANSAIGAAQFTVHEAMEAMKAIRSHYTELQNSLKVIEAKKLLKIRLNSEERAIWTLYGKNKRREP